MDSQTYTNPISPLEPTVSSIGSHCYALGDFLHKILSPLIGKIKLLLEEHILKLTQEINLQNEDCHVSFDIISLVTNVPVQEVFIRNSLNTNPSIPVCSPLQSEDIMELLDICLTITYF
jgi:hypothetical protein